MTTSSSGPAPQRLWLPAVLALTALAAEVALNVGVTAALLRNGRLLAALEGDPLVFTALEIEVAQGRLLPLVVAWLGSVLASVLLFGWFLRRCWLVVRASGVRNLRYGPRWAVLGWFVPVMGWFVPKRIVDDLWRATDRGSALPYWEYRPRSTLVWCWWVSFLATYVLGRVDLLSGAFLVAALTISLASSLLGAAVMVRLLLRTDAYARAAGVALDDDWRARLQLPRSWPAAAAPSLAAAAALVLLAGTVTGVREGGQLPEDLRPREAAALAALAAATPEPGVSLPPRPQRVPVPPEPTPAAVVLDPTGPFESSLLEPPGLERVTDDPEYAGAYDLQRVLSTVPEGDRPQVRESLESYGFVRGQQAAFASPQEHLTVLVMEFGSPAAAADWVAAGAEGEEAFAVDTPAGVGYRTQLAGGLVLDSVAVAVGRIAYELDLTHPARLTSDSAVVLLRLQHAAATAQPT